MKKTIPDLLIKVVRHIGVGTGGAAPLFYICQVSDMCPPLMLNSFLRPWLGML